MFSVFSAQRFAVFIECNLLSFMRITVRTVIQRCGYICICFFSPRFYGA